MSIGNVEFPDPLGADVVEISDPLRRCRNAVLHVPHSGDYFDSRILDLIGYPQGPRLMHTTHGALGRLLLEEMLRRKATAEG